MDKHGEPAREKGKAAAHFFAWLIKNLRCEIIYLSLD